MSTTLRTAKEILTEARQAGETITGPRVGDESLRLEIDGAAFAVGDEIEDEQVIGYTWATYLTPDDLDAMDYQEHDGGTTEASLLAAIDRFRALVQAQA